MLDSYYHFYLLKTWSRDEKRLQCVGYMLPEIVAAMAWTNKFSVDSVNRTITIPYFQGTESDALAEQLHAARTQDRFAVLRSWRDELYPVASLDRSVTMERAGSPLFGIQTFGVHMTAFCRVPHQGMMLWVPCRAANKTYGGMLDNSVAGGIAAGEEPFESMLREAAEEASLPADAVKRSIRAAGTVSYFHVRDARAGGEISLLQPETQYVYDLELGAEVVLKPSDLEVQDFKLCTMGEVTQALRARKFKPNCALVLIDFLIRHGVITAQNEPRYLDIVPRLHRRLTFEELVLGSSKSGTGSADMGATT